MSKEPKKHVVFLSHATPDRARAEIVREALEAAGLPCWVAYRDIKPGADWGESINAAIEEMEILLVLFSEAADASRHVVREVAASVDIGKEILPVRLEDVEPSKSMRYHLHTLHRLDAFPGPLENHLPEVIQNVKSVLAGNTTRVRKREIKDIVIERPTAAPLPAELLLITGLGVETAEQAVELLTRQLAEAEVELKQMDPKIKDSHGPVYLDCLENIETFKMGLRQAEALLREDKDVASQAIGIIADSKNAIDSHSLNLAENRFEEAVNLCMTRRVQDDDIWSQLKELKARLADAIATPPPASPTEPEPPVGTDDQPSDIPSPSEPDQPEPAADSKEPEPEPEPEPETEPEPESPKEVGADEAPESASEEPKRIVEEPEPALDEPATPDDSKSEPEPEPDGQPSDQEPEERTPTPPPPTDTEAEDPEPVPDPVPIAPEPDTDRARSGRTWLIAAVVVLLLGIVSFLVFQPGDSSTPSFAQSPQGQIVPTGQDVTLSVKPIGREPIGIQWLRDGQPIAGATNVQYTFPASQGVTAISVRLKNELGETTSEPVSVVAGRRAKIESVTPDLSEIVVHPARGQTLRAQIVEQPGATNTFTWFFAGETATTTTPEFTLQDVSFGQAGPLILVVANQWGSDTNRWQIKVDGTPVIKQQPENVAVVAGQAATFSIIADGEPPLTYFWLSGGRFLQRTEKPQVSVPTSVDRIEPPGAIQVLVSNRWGFVKSEPAGLTLNLPPRFTRQPTDLALREGDNGRIEALAVNGTPSYRWYRDGQLLRAESRPFVEFQSATRALDGNYHVVAANPYGSVTSVVARVSVRRGPKLGTKWEYIVGVGLPIEFVPIPAGNFDMGSPEPEPGRGPDEAVHRVTFKSSFWISKHEVTQSQYEALIGILPAQSVKGANIPIHNLTWKEATNYCAQLDVRLTGTLPPGFALRLPTEAEWEYAARGGVPAMYGFDMSQFQLEQYAVNRNFGDQSILEVGQHKANGYDVHDVHGNVEEWCFDWYKGRLRSATDPVSLQASAGRIVRGGAWNDTILDLRVAKRRHAPQDSRAANRGFRIVAGLAIPKK